MSSIATPLFASTSSTPRSKSGGVVSAFAVRISCAPVSGSVEKETRSVKVPPTSVAARSVASSLRLVVEARSSSARATSALDLRGQLARGRARRARPGSPRGSPSARARRSRCPPLARPQELAAANAGIRGRVPEDVEPEERARRTRPRRRRDRDGQDRVSHRRWRTSDVLSYYRREKVNREERSVYTETNRGRRRLPASGAATPGAPAGAGPHARVAGSGQRALGGLPLADRERPGRSLADRAAGDRGEPRRRGGDVLPRGRQRDDAGRPRGRPARVPPRAAVGRGVRRARPAGQGLGLHGRPCAAPPRRRRAAVPASRRGVRARALGQVAARRSARRRTSSGPATGRTTPRSTATRPRSSPTSRSRRSGS